jgi:hypothetical protein
MTSKREFARNINSTIWPMPRNCDIISDITLYNIPIDTTCTLYENDIVVDSFVTRKNDALLPFTIPVVNPYCKYELRFSNMCGSVTYTATFLDISTRKNVVSRGYKYKSEHAKKIQKETIRTITLNFERWDLFRHYDLISNITLHSIPINTTCTLYGNHKVLDTYVTKSETNEVLPFVIPVVDLYCEYVLEFSNECEFITYTGSILKPLYKKRVLAQGEESPNNSTYQKN